MSDLKTESIDNYNPFGEPGVQGTLRQAAVLPLSDSPPIYDHDDIDSMYKEPSALLPSVPTQSTMTVADLQRRQAELDARAAQLDMRERQQAQQEAWRSEHGYSTTDLPNWPPLPRFCCIRPCVRIDFVSDIPGQVRWMAQYLHYYWMAYTLILFLNVFGTLSYLVISTNTAEAGPLFGVAILLAVVLPPASFFCWNRPIYKALKNDSSFNFCVFFPFFGVQMILILIQLLGIDYLGACGWINSIKTMSIHKGIGGFMIFIAILFSLAAVTGIYILIQVHRYYRKSGASSSKAKQELTQNMIRSGVAANSI